MHCKELFGVAARGTAQQGQVIDEYTYNKRKAPQSLEDLVQEGYLQAVPKDPMTDSSTTRRQVIEDPLQSVDQTNSGIFNVRSGSDKTALDGTAYADW
jgi:general secretion pathway protein G